MTTVIDWNKAPRDATHASIFGDNYVYWYKDISSNSYSCLCSPSAENKWRHGKGSPKHRPLTNRPTRSEIDLKTLNVTFGEFDRETKLRLAGHVIDGGKVEYCIDERCLWYPVKDEFHFVYGLKYRAAWTERDKIQLSIDSKLSELKQLYSELLKEDGF